MNVNCYKYIFFSVQKDLAFHKIVKYLDETSNLYSDDVNLLRQMQLCIDTNIHNISTVIQFAIKNEVHLFLITDRLTLMKLRRQFF